ncbi:hypothetical protein [Actinobacillus delphinicola]|uniref:hypothetical protein n=1 Tax=Actinobacillus delphinicola TaxID=51161 RepID=UPI002441C8B3|nr:hypothetical protein [Actinobacillus delphinicola]
METKVKTMSIEDTKKLLAEKNKENANKKFAPQYGIIKDEDSITDEYVIINLDDE